MGKLNEFAKKHKVLTGIIIVFAVIIFFASISPDKNDEKATTTNTNPVANSPEVENKQPEKTKEWQKVISINADANKQSETFALEGGQQKLIYKTTGANIMCIIYLLDENSTLDKDGGIPAIMLSEAKEGDTLLRKSAGNYYLDIKNSIGNCDVEIQELK